MTLSKKQRAEVFAMFAGRCAYCGCNLPEKGWHADHVEPILRDFKWVVDAKTGYYKTSNTGVCFKPENQRLDNFCPSCRACNLDKSSMPLEVWRKSLERKVEILRHNHSAYRHAERFGIVGVLKAEVVFYFETLAASAPGDESSTK